MKMSTLISGCFLFARRHCLGASSGGEDDAVGSLYEGMEI